MPIQLFWCLIPTGPLSSVVSNLSFLLQTIGIVLIPVVLLTWISIAILSKKSHSAGALILAGLGVYLLLIIVAGVLIGSIGYGFIYVIFSLPFVVCMGLIPTVLISLHYGRKISAPARSTVIAVWILVFIGLGGSSIPFLGMLSDTLGAQHYEPLQALSYDVCIQRGGTPEGEVPPGVL